MSVFGRLNFSELVRHRGILAAAVVARRPWNRRRIIGMKSEALYGLCRTGLELTSLAGLMATCQSHKARVRKVCRRWPGRAWWHRFPQL